MLKQLKHANNNFILAGLIQSSSTIVVVLVNAFINVILLSNFPKSWIPYYYFAATVMNVISASILVPILAKPSTKPAFYLECICGIIIFLFIFLLPSHLMLINFSIIFVLLVINLAFGAIAWNAAASAFDTRTFRDAARYFTIVNGLVSALAGAAIYFLIVLYGNKIVLIAILFSILVSCFGLYCIKPLKYEIYNKQTQLSPFKYPIFIKIAFYVILTAVVFTFIDYFLKLKMHEYDADAIAKYMTIIYALGNILTAAAQLYSRKILERFGLSGLLLGIPVLLFIAMIPVIFYPNLFFISLLFISWLGINYSYSNLGRQIVINTLPRIIAKKARFYSKAYISPIGLLLGAVIITIFSYHFELYPYQLIIVIILAALTYLVFKIKKEYSRTLFKSIEEKRFYLPLGYLTYDRSLIKKELAYFFNSLDASYILLGFSLMKQLSLNELPENINLLMAHNDFSVRLNAVKIIKLFGDKTSCQLLLERLSVEDNAKVIWAILETLLKKNPKLIKDNIKRYLIDARPVFRAVAIIGVVKYGNLVQFISAFLLLNKMLFTDDVNERLWAIKALGFIPIGVFSKELGKFIYDENCVIATEAMRTAEKLHAYSLLPDIIKQVGRRGMNHEIRKIIIKSGSEAIPYLISGCKLLNLHQIKPLIRMLCAIDDNKVEAALIELMEINNVYFQNELSKQIAIRTLHVRASPTLLMRIKTAIYDHLKKIEFINQLNEIAKTDLQRHEIFLRKQVHEKCLLQWLAVYTKPAGILRLQPILLSEQNDELTKLKQAQALEFLDSIITDRDLARKVFSVIEAHVDKKQGGKEILLSDINDPWLKQVFSFNRFAKKELAMDAIEKAMNLRAISIFSRLPAEILLSITEEFVLKDMVKNQYIFHPQEYAEGLYCVVSGEIDLYDQNELIYTVQAKECFGLIALFDDYLRLFTAKASSDGAYLFLKKEVFERLTEDYPDIMYEVTKNIIRKFRTILENKYRNNKDNYTSLGL
jgi:CRP-like cAMP-binding protein